MSFNFSSIQKLELPATADMHVHLRDGALMKAVTPTIRKGGVNTVFVMPNLVPPITTVAQALAYKAELEAIEPNVTYLMSLYLHPSITPATIVEAAAAGIAGVKSYPAGVTTNSSAGVVDYKQFYPVFAQMEQSGLVLNLHGECPSTPGSDIDVLNAEPRFLPVLKTLHDEFPHLKIVLEHCTTAAALEAVLACGPKVVGTITAHHLSLTISDVVADPKTFCKPVAKYPSDRIALLRAVTSGSPKFFFGSDSAPHLTSAKIGGLDKKPAAGVFTQQHGTGYVLDAIDEGIKEGVLEGGSVRRQDVEGFLSGFGRSFYGVGGTGERIVARRGVVRGEGVLKDGDVEVFLFRGGESGWVVEWMV